MVQQPGSAIPGRALSGARDAIQGIAKAHRFARQVRKEATVADDSGAGVSLAELPPKEKSRPKVATAPGRALSGARDAIQGIAKAHRFARQVRKEATVAGDSGAGMSLAELPPRFVATEDRHPPLAR